MARPLAVLLVMAAACVPSSSRSTARAPAVAAAAPAEPEGAPRSPLAWADLSPATFARAKAERRYVILHGAAEWCHWCHVMEATTYHDPEVRKIIDERFIAAKVDVDSRPDIEERYGDWGWPATVIFSPDAEELGKLRGYVAPEEFARVLREVVANGAKKGDAEGVAEAPREPLSDQTLAWIAKDVERELADYWDEEQGGWGKRQKAALPWDTEWALEHDRAHALVALRAEERLFDPVWGGIYQYSAATDWEHPHFEKLMTYQAGAIDNFALAYATTHDPAMLAAAQDVRRYVDAFLHGSDGGFYATQDADLNAHDPSRPFLSGHEYYAKDDAARRTLGVPRVDAHEYADLNGLAIAAYASLYQASGDASALDEAKRAAAQIMQTHATKRGGVAHDATPEASVLHLADNACFAWGLLRLHDVTGDATYLDRARDLAAWMKRELADGTNGALFSSTADPDEVGVFARRFVDFESTTMAVRVLAKLGDRDAARRALTAVATPEQIGARGRMLGDLLLAIEAVTRP